MHLQYFNFIAMRLTLGTSTKFFFKQILPFIFYAMFKAMHFASMCSFGFLPDTFE